MNFIRKKLKKRTIIFLSAGVVVILAGGLALYYWLQADPRLQPNMTEKEVSRILGSEGTTVRLNRPPDDLPYAKYYVFYERGPDLFGNRRIVTVFYDRGGRLLRYEVTPAPPAR